MTTSLEEHLKSVVSLEDKPISPELLGYFDAASRDEAYDLILSAFQELADQGVTRAFLARRTGKSPEQITRLLGAPGNWTLETFAHLALAMGFKPKHGLERLSDMRNANDHHPGVSKALNVELARTAEADAGLHILQRTGSVARVSEPPAYTLIQKGGGSIVLDA